MALLVVYRIENFDCYLRKPCKEANKIVYVCAMVCGTQATCYGMQNTGFRRKLGNYLFSCKYEVQAFN